MIHTSKNGEMMVLQVPLEWEGLTVDSLLREYWKAPKKLIHVWRMSKKITINHEPANWNVPMNIDDTLSIPVFENNTNETVFPKNLGITILYEDDYLLIANKPAGMDTHPAHPNHHDTLLNGVAFHLDSLGKLNYLKHIHRLDQDTTGAVLFAKSPFVGSLLDKMLEERKIKRSYLAIVQGVIKTDKGTVNEPIGRDRHHATRRRVSPSGQTAITHFQVLSRFQKERLTLIKCTLDTGRTHQIRVHMSHINHPLAGDKLYGGKSLFNRQALHAYHMEFQHPIIETKMTCTAPFLDQNPIFPIFMA